MAATYALKVLTPETKFFDDEATQISIRTTVGDLGILANHYSLAAIVKPGKMKIMRKDGAWRTAEISSGIIKVGKNSVTVLIDNAEWEKESK
ncbi:MAG: ATP synthase F1 subunit epsilon [Oscillospiraceae bacterium]|nr:ATP synthase F1 subunit epsilon [Oscillospiraceae bacterium]